ncbi:MAG: hypothetical protein Q7J35_01880 [Candidatus Methanoperedens sp.]|nr:hypothetical protein [Candidatus Methanoperedens sp.]
MLSHKQNQKEKETQIQDFPLDEKLQALSDKDLHDLVQTLLNRNPQVRKLILEWFMDRSKDTKNINKKQVSKALNGERLWENWNDAKPIISKFNEYGGGPEDEEEEECCSYLDHIEKLAEKGDISTEVKCEFLDELFEEYNVGNSGLEDKMMELCFILCKTKEEWEYLVKKLDEHPSDWRKKLIMDIQKEQLHDDKAFLQERLKKLHYGMDYWDLAEFYDGKGDRKKAVEIAEEGLLKGQGRQTELFEFLSDHYAKIHDTANLERIVQCAITKESDEKEMLGRLFEYYKTQNDYENAKKALLEAFKYVKGAGYIPEVRSYAHYNKMKKFLTKADWREIEPKIIRDVHEKDLEDYMRICLDKNMKKEAIDILLNSPKKRHGSGLLSDGEYDLDEFAQRLKEEFPEDIIKYYWQKAYSKIQNGNRNTYFIAARYLDRVKHIYIDILNEESNWEQRFSNLKVEFKKRPAFLEELKNYEKRGQCDLDDY